MEEGLSGGLGVDSEFSLVGICQLHWTERLEYGSSFMTKYGATFWM